MHWLYRAVLLGFGLSSVCWADDITLHGVVQKAIDHSYAVKIAAVDVGIARTDIMAAKSEYYPQIQGRINIEYLKSLDSGYRPVTTIGGTIIPAGTRFQNSIGLQMSQTLVDFGERKHKVGMSKHGLLAKTATVDQALRDLKSQVMELYANALQSYKAILAQEEILGLAQESYQMKKRLFQSGTIDKVEMTDDSILVAQALDDLQVARREFNEQLQKLSYYTGEVYDQQQIALMDMDNEPIDLRAFDASKSAEARSFDEQLLQKDEEVLSLKRRNLPHASLYSYYNLYGFDPNHFAGSVTDMSQRTISLGLSISMPVVDGHKNRAAVERAMLERDKLALQKEEALAQLTTKANTYQQQVEDMGVHLQTRVRILERSHYKGELVERLSVQQVVDKTKSLQARIDERRKRLESEKALIQGLLALKQRRLLEEG